jgi:hypothetical protein
MVTWRSMGTQHKGFIGMPDVQRSFECYVDVDYCSNWDPLHSEDPSSAKSM